MKVVRILLLVFLVTPAVCQRNGKPTRETPPSFVPVEAWLKGPDRQDFPWKVRITQALTLQQRHLVQIRVTVRGRDLLNGVPIRDLHTVAKVADEHGNWLEGQSYSHFVPKADFSPYDTLQSFTNLYLRPGSYTIAMIAYDVLHHDGNLWRAHLFVPQVEGPLPDLDRDFPVVEFLSPAVPPVSILGTAAAALFVRDTLALGHGVARLPIQDREPLRIDVIVNLSETQMSSWPYKQSQGETLQIANLLSQLSPARGCVRVSAMDILRHQVIADRLESGKIDWDSISGLIASTELNKIDVSALTKKDTAILFKQLLERIIEDNDSCGLLNIRPKHVLIIVSWTFSFPPHAQVEPLESYFPAPRCYYFELLSSLVGKDEIGRLLKPVGLKRLAFSDPLGLRRNLDHLIRDLAAPSGQENDTPTSSTGSR